MRVPFIAITVFAAAVTAAHAEAQAQTTAPAGPPAGVKAPPVSEKENANPCRDEVAAALKKLRSTSAFRLSTSMITDKGPVSMEVEYVLPDKMHQKVTEGLTKTTTEVILVGEKAWGNEGQGWVDLPNELTQQLKAQMYESVVEQQTDIGNYSCKGRAKVEGRDVLAYKLEEEPAKDSDAPKNETFRMFYVDATTGLPASNALLSPGREDKPMFKAAYSYPIDIAVAPPADVQSTTPPPAAGEPPKPAEPAKP